MILIRKSVLFIALFLISLSLGLGCAKKNNGEVGASAKGIDSVTVADISLENKDGGGASFKKFKFAASDSVCEINISFTCPAAMPNSEALVELRKNFIKQAFGEKYAGLKPAEVVDRVGKEIRDEAENARAGNEELCAQEFLYSDTLTFPVPGFLQYKTGNYEYTCGAHGNGNFFYCLYNLEDGKRVETKDIFVSGWEQSVTKLIIEKRLKDKGWKSLADDSYAKEENFIPNGNILSFNDPKGITFVYNTYVIAPYAEGPQDILVSWGDLKPYLNKSSAIYPKLRFE